MKELRSRGLPALHENSIIKHASGTSNMPTCVRSDNPVVFIAFRVSPRVISAKYIFPGTAFLKNMVAMLYTDIMLASLLFHTAVPLCDNGRRLRSPDDDRGSDVRDTT